MLEKDNIVTIHQRNIQALTVEIYKTHKDLNPTSMKEVCMLSKGAQLSHPKQNLLHPNPQTVSYGINFCV